MRDGDVFHLRADSEGGKTWLAWLEPNPARLGSDELPRAVVEWTPADHLLRHGADVHARDDFGETPLHNARSPEIARLLVGHGVDVDAPATPSDRQADNRGRAPLHVALLTASFRGVEMPEGRRRRRRATSA